MENSSVFRANPERARAATAEGIDAVERRLLGKIRATRWLMVLAFVLGFVVRVGTGVDLSGNMSQKDGPVSRTEYRKLVDTVERMVQFDRTGAEIDERLLEEIKVVRKELGLD